jgi:nitrogen regulatory protein P-II 1
MKKIEAIIQPDKFDDVREALKRIGFDVLTVSDVRGHGRQREHRAVYRGQEYQADSQPRVKLELVVTADRADEVLRTLAAAARTGRVGDGKIFAYDIGDVIRIRNGDWGEAAL